MIFASKVVIAVFAVIYTIIAYTSELVGESRLKKIHSLLMFLITMGIHAIAFGVLWMIKEDSFYLLFGLGTGAGLLIYNILLSLLYRNHDPVMKNHMCFFLSVGMIILSRLNPDKCLRQAGMIGVAMLISLLIPVIIRTCGFIRNLSLGFAIAGFAVLLYVLVRGNTINGARISLTLAGFTFQPTEFIKIIFVLFLSAFLAKKISRMRILIAALFCAGYIGILVLCKDLGSAAIFAVTFLFLVYEASGKRRYFLRGCGIFLIGLAGAYLMFSHIRVRFDMWIDPWRDVEGGGYQIVQSLFSIANGDWFGTGLMQGKPTLIPFVDADMIFSAIAEELGVLFGICLILNCLHCYYTIMHMANRLDTGFYRYVAYGLGNAFIFQVLLTIGGGTKYIPLTGITLPFISYGGSSILATGTVFGILQGLALVANDEVLARELKMREKISGNVADLDGMEEEPLWEEMLPVSWNTEDAETDSDEDRKNSADAARVIRKRNHAFRNSILFVTALFLGLCMYLIWFTAVRRTDVLRNEYNVLRTRKRAEEYLRGTIYSADGNILAYTDSGSPDRRIYPYGDLFAHVVGYQNGSGSGIEAKENYMLSVADVSIVTEWKHVHSGELVSAGSVYTTLDTDLQQTAYDALGDRSGAVIVMRPKTGEILAMVSKPSFDPGNMEDVFQTISQDSNSTVLMNRATQGQYPPGSTFKIFTLLEYLREYPGAATEYAYHCDGSFSYGDHTIRCYNGKQHGDENLMDSFAYSCNCSFGNIGLQLNRNRYGKLLDSMLMNQYLPYPMAYEKSRCNVTEETTDAALVQICIGQGTTTMSPLHLAMITSAIAYDGILMKPYVVESFRQCDGKTQPAGYAGEYGRLMTLEEAAVLTEYMASVTDYGTAANMKEEYRIAGKTGTAEHSVRNATAHAWFTGFAPYENPEIVVTVIMERSGAAAGTAVPAAEKIFETYFDKY